MSIYANSGLLRVCSDTRVYILGTKQWYLLAENHVPFLSVISVSFLGRDRAQRHNDADVERERRARARSFVRSANGSRKKKPLLF